MRFTSWNKDWWSWPVVEGVASVTAQVSCFLRGSGVARSAPQQGCKGVDTAALIRLDRTGFLTLIHQHPTLLVDLIALQHRQLRQQRADARHVY